VAASPLERFVEATGFGGSLRAGYWSSTRTLDDQSDLGTAAVWLRAAPRLGPSLSLFAEGWVRSEDVFGDGEVDGLLREAYLGARHGPVDIRAGKQIIAWGRADRINPTDNLTPRDYTALVPDDEDQRFGVPAVRATFFHGGLSLTGIWLIEFESSVVPLRRPPAPLRIQEREPGGGYEQGAVRFEQTGSRVDWSLSYFDGLDTIPDLALERTGPRGPELELSSHRVRVVGADAATAIGPYGLRGEAAYTFTEDDRGDNPYIKNPFLFVVVGADRTFLEHLNVNVQYILRVVTRYQSPFGIADPLAREVAVQSALLVNQLDRVQNSFSLRVSNRWLRETLEAELVAVVSVDRFGWVLRPRVTYAITDRWRITVGGDLFGGERLSFFGNLRDNSTAFAEVRWSF
jgi:hypothetical protein